MESIGNTSLLDRKKIGFLAGSKIAPLSVLPTFDWASEVATCEDVAVVSGFHSELERQVLDILLKGRCGIVCVLARCLYTKVPPEYKSAFEDGRVLFVTEEKQNRATRESAFRRNRLVVVCADEVYLPKIEKESSISKLLTGSDKPFFYL